MDKFMYLSDDDIDQGDLSSFGEATLLDKALKRRADKFSECSFSGGPRYFIFFLIFFITLISSCGKKQSKKKLEKDKNKRTISILEAKYSDIPLPIGFKLIHELKPPGPRFGAEFISYAGLLGRDKVIDYYLASMEKHGWKIVDLSNEKEGLLFCRKPWKYCVVSVRDDLKSSKKNYHCFVHLFIKNKLRELKTEKDINAKDVNDFDVRL